jgi:hypothetical protein
MEITAKQVAEILYRAARFLVELLAEALGKKK